MSNSLKTYTLISQNMLVRITYMLPLVWNLGDKESTPKRRIRIAERVNHALDVKHRLPAATGQYVHFIVA